MSYTTQKEFFNVPFRNEDPKLPDRKRSDGALMTYDLCTDGRAWALDKQKRSNYILDVVHKARFKKALLHPEGQFELTKDYLINLDAHDLADYILSLQGEIKRKNESVQALEDSRKSLGEQLETLQKQSDELTEIRQQSVFLEQERADFEQQMEDLELVIVDLKDRADRHDVLAKENESLRQQLQKQRVESADRIRLANAEAEANFNRLRAEECEKLEAELILFKAQYEDLRHQKRELKEQLQKASVQQGKLTELKRQLALEQDHREQVEEELERVLSLYDQRFGDADRQNFAAIEELEAQRSEQWAARRSVSADRESGARGSSGVAERVVERCENCEQLEEELESLRSAQMENLQERDRQNRELQEQVDSLRKELDFVELTAGGDEQSSKLAEELQKCRAELKAKVENEQEAQAQITQLEKNLAQVDAKLAEEAKKTEQLQADILEAKQLEGKQLEAKQLEAKQLEAKQLEAKQLEAKQLEAKQLEAKQLEAAAKSVTSVRADSPASVDNEIQKLQKLLEEAQGELALKVKKMDLLTEENTRLQAEAVKQQENVEKFEAIQQQQLKELESAKSALAQSKDDHMTSQGDSQLDDIKKLNAELQQEVARLQKEQLAAQNMSRGALESAESQAHLLKTIETLRSELQSANEAVKEKEEVIGTLKIQAESVQHLEDAGLQEKKQMADKIEELKEKLEQCEDRVGGQARISQVGGKLVEKIPSAESEESVISDEQVTEDLVESKESVESGEEVLENLVEELVQRKSSVRSGAVLSDDQRGAVLSDDQAEDLPKTGEPDKSEVRETKLGSASSEETIKEAMEEAKSPSAKSKTSEAEDEQVEGTIEEDVFASEADKEETAEIGDEDDAEEHEVRDSMTKKRSITGGSIPEQMTQPEQGTDLDDDIFDIGHSDPDKTRMIAIKIVRRGIGVLGIRELYHLLQEISRAAIEGYRRLGQNVRAVDEAMNQCKRILDSVKKMGNSEMMSMLASPATQIPIRNPLLVEDIPVAAPSKSRTRPKSTNLTMGHQDSRTPGRVLAGEYSGRPRDTFVSNIQGRIKVDDFCRTRPWRAPKTPTETFVASTLADGSRLVARQKRYF